MADIFICYQREDRQFAETLSNALEQLGFDVWWDFELLSGDRYRKVMREVLDQCSAAVVLWSARSVNSQFVIDESTHARNRGKLCPARIDRVDLPFEFGQIHTDDLVDWSGERTHPGFRSLLRAIERRVGREARLGGSRRSAQSQALTAELEAFKASQLAGDVPAFTTFLREHPRGAFAAFVRGQIETMEDAPVPRGRAAPDYISSERASDELDAVPEEPRVVRRNLRWPLIAGVAAVVIALVAYVILEYAQEDAQHTQTERESQGEAAQRAPREFAEARVRDPETKAPGSRAAPGPVAYDLEQLDPNVRGAVERAREAERLATAAAGRARDAARQAEADGVRTPHSGLGIDSRSADSTGNRYAGFFERGVRSNVGVFEWGENGINKGDFLRYEGEWANDKMNGAGVAYYSGGRRYAGSIRNEQRAGPGVFLFSDRGRYEGDWYRDRFNGYGVHWDAQGNVIQAGIWTDDKLTTSLGP